jgi:signal peptidase II
MRRWLSLFVIIVAVLAADQISKRIVVDNLRLGESVEPIPALGDFFQITRSQNTGAAFGFLSQAGDVFLIIAVVVTIALMFFYHRLPANATLMRFGIGLVCGGALGNALDRLEYGAVVDFIHYQIPGVVSNVSNLADHAIVIGVIVIFIDSWRADREKKRTEDAGLRTE